MPVPFWSTMRAWMSPAPYSLTSKAAPSAEEDVSVVGTWANEVTVTERRKSTAGSKSLPSVVLTKKS